ncbi:MAG: DUF58 domain-containing protein, partial [Actinomycetota bacterium]|nr:DUF58 domain-containing protein [Actinomycetota bacterium]
GRYAGSHRSRRYGASLDFADHRQYVPGDDPRRLDVAAYQRLGRLLVKLYEAEDEAAARVVVDLSASMGFGRKARTAREVAAVFAALAHNGQDRVRVLLAGSDGVDAGPWFRGSGGLPAVEARLLAAATDPPSAARPDLAGAIHRARGDGPAGPTVVVSDLLDDAWPDAVRELAAGRCDGVVVHLLGREDLEPGVRGDLRLADAETGEELEVGIDEEALAAYQATCEAWLAQVEAACGRHGIAYARLVDDASVEELATGTLRRLGVVT